MAIPEISIISDFEAGVKCLQDPSIISKFLTIQMYNFWRWGAVILAIFATFTSIFRRIKHFIIRFRNITPSAEPLLQLFSDDFEFSDIDTDEDEDDECSSVSSEEEIEEDETSTSLFKEEGDWQNGNLMFRRGFSWSDFSKGNGVVKLWDSLGLSFDFDYENSCKNIVSMWDFNQNQDMDYVGGSVLAAPSQAVVLSAEQNEDENGIVLGAYDTRMRHRKPAVTAKWGSPVVAGKVVGINTDVAQKIYVRDDVNGVLKVGDFRNLKSPLKTVKKSHGGGKW